MSRIAYCAVHPAIGVARVGDSPDEYFLGPEVPGAEESPASYKDKAGRVKRQAARFRIFAYDDRDAVIGELTADDAEIAWTVHLVNGKGAAKAFAGPGRRNDSVADRSSLVIDPGPRTVAGRQTSSVFDTGSFLGTPVPLGELRTDDEGRLIVLGGFGRSASIPEDQPLPSFADNDGWHDDTSDGPVTATVRKDGVQIEVRPAWVVVAPPDFAPGIGNLVTLFDVAENAAVERGLLPERKEISFERDIVPILTRAMGYQWVNQSATRGHRRAVDMGKGAERIGDFFEADHLALLKDPGERGAQARRRVFAVIRQPHEDADDATAKRQATAAFMPQLSGDGGSATPGRPRTWFTVTPLQYRRLSQWADGQFTAGTPEEPLTEPAALDRAALEACVGGPFFPGIEMSSRAREPGTYAAAFRFRADQPPGCMTERMAVPWQADFTDCRHFWWPAQRPDDVIVDQDYAAVTAALFPDGNSPLRPISTTAFPRWRWDRGIGDSLPTSLDAGRRADRRHREMVNEWSQLGFVTPAANETGVFVETERAPYAGLRDRDYFHIMLNLHEYPDFLPTAWKLARDYLATAAAYQHDPMIDTDLRPFRYEERAFDARLDSTYQDLVDRVAQYDPAHDRAFRTKADAIDRLRQSGPLNQTDGVWLRNVATIGPINDLTGFLTQIWVDEVGAGNPAQNHANIFTHTLEAAGITTAPITSKEYAQDPSLLESSFTLPLFQLVVSQFTDQFLPELLGMTLYFEWESVELATTARLLEKFGLDSTYYRLHVAIDNADVGHGAIAKRAVKRYLSGFADDDVRQQQWQRIWNGYVAFRITGTLGQDLVDKLLAPSRARDRVIDMIEEKKRYGALNHGAAGDGMNNNLFDNPSQLLDLLQKSGQIVPGDPDKSPFMQQMKFEGRMYKVFTADEQDAWADWIRSLAQPAAADRPAPSPFAAAAKPTAPAEQPPAPVGEVPHLTYSSSAEEVSKHPRGTLLGHGAAH
ncbi:LodA/GoxA family CTQ-dependent oxidase [Paractinoplanes globisporus]|uniref:LodA/GoxA family CTQ-dependent oxidase n=1 Tax=Paractinoplanes globisporus TaxID=113565 RepID=A0ABW6WGJ9_9ACTN|nr:LodA/GoxA family CTQ-dependent oxidase [Actinoplanes globisporus]